MCVAIATECGNLPLLESFFQSIENLCNDGENEVTCYRFGTFSFDRQMAIDNLK